MEADLIFLVNQTHSEPYEVVLGLKWVTHVSRTHVAGRYFNISQFSFEILLEPTFAAWAVCHPTHVHASHLFHHVKKPSRYVLRLANCQKGSPGCYRRDVFSKVFAIIATKICYRLLMSRNLSRRWCEQFLLVQIHDQVSATNDCDGTVNELMCWVVWVYQNQMPQTTKYTINCVGDLR